MAEGRTLADLSKADAAPKAAVVAKAAGALFIRSYERGERVHLAMVSRGFTGTMPQLSAPSATGRSRGSSRGRRGSSTSPPSASRSPAPAPCAPGPSRARLGSPHAGAAPAG